MKANRTERIKKELTFIIPAFSFMWEEINRNTDEDDRKSLDYSLANQICRQLAVRIKVYGKLQKDVIKKFNNIREKQPDAKHNVFLSGLALLTTHMEIKNKSVNIGLSKEIVQLQDLCFEYFDNKQINETLEWAENFREELKI